MAIRIQNSTIIDDGRNIVNAGIATVTSVSIGNTQVISSARQLQNITSLDATTTATIESAIANAPNTFTELQVTGISTLGITSATNLTAQQLNVSGIATVNSNLIVNGNTLVADATNNRVGIGTTNPQVSLDIVGNSRVSGVLTATTFSGNLSNTLTLNTSGTGLSGSTTFNNSGNATFTVTSNATSDNTNSTIVARNGSGGFSAGIVTATFIGNITGNVTGNLNSSGVNTATTISGTTATYTTGNFTTGNIVTGVVTTISGTNISYSGVGTIATLNSTTGTITNLTNTNINTSGITTTARLNVGTGGTIITTTSSGFVGINSTVPGSMLAVGGTITELYNGQYWNVVTQADVGYGASQVPLNQYLGQLAFLDDFSANGLRREGGGEDDVTVNSSGFVGIATTNPIQPIQINSATSSNILVVDPSGDLGIGTTNPTSKLHVVGDTLVTGVSTASRLTLNGSNNTETNGGQIFLNGTTGNRIDFNPNGVAAPSFTTRSVGTKIVLWPNISGASIDYAFGIEGGTLWYSVPQALNTNQHRWYGGTTQLADLKGSGELVLGTTSLTGTASQRLQVTGGGYFSGNLGIGTTNPTSALQVTGTFSNSGIGTFANGNTTFGTSSASSLELGLNNTNNAGTLKIWGTTSNNYGLIQATTTNLHIDASSGTYLNFYMGSFISFGTGAGAESARFTGSTGTLTLGTITPTGTSNQRLQVTGGGYFSGSVGIGLTNPTSTLQVSGDTLVSGTTTSTSFNTGTVGSQTSGILTTTTTTASQVLDNLPTSTFQTARYQVSIACTGQLVTVGMTTAFTSVGTIIAGAGYTEATYTNVALTGGSGNDARANIGIGLSYNAVGFTSAVDLIVTTANHGLPSGVGTIAVSFASSIPNSTFTGFAVTAGNIYYAVGVGTTTLQLFNNANGTSQVTGIGTTTFTGVGNTMTKSGGVSSVQIVSPGSGYVTGNSLSATLGTLGSGFSFTVSTAVRNYQSTDVMIMQSVGSASTACDIMEYATIANSEILGSFSADISGTNARLLFTPTYRNNTIKYVRTGITV